MYIYVGCGPKGSNIGIRVHHEAGSTYVLGLGIESNMESDVSDVSERSLMQSDVSERSPTQSDVSERSPMGLSSPYTGVILACSTR